MKLIKQVILYYKEGTSDKVYEIDLCEVRTNKYVVNFRFGKRNSALKDGTKTILPVNLEKAENIYRDLVNSKMEKGYRTSLDDFEEKKEHTKSIEKARPISEEEVSKNNELRKQSIIRKINEISLNIEQSYSQTSGQKQSIFESSLSRLIWRASELRIKGISDTLANLLGKGSILLDYCIIYALGNCFDGNGRILDILTRIYNSSLTNPMIRRITAEAMLKMFTENQKQDFRNKLINLLPNELRNTLITHPDEFTMTLRSFMEKATYSQYDILNILYLIDTDITRNSLIEVIRNAPLKPNYFKQIRHIFKAAEYRHDEEIFGLISYKFEKEKAMFNSNVYHFYLDGKWINYSDVKKHIARPDSKYAYSSKTRNYLRDRVWRKLRRLGNICDDDYVKMAIGILLSITDKDGGSEKTLTYWSYRKKLNRKGKYEYINEKVTISFDKFSRFLAFNHILYGKSNRYKLKGKTWRCINNYKPNDPEPNVREESFPELWDKNYRKILYLLSKSKCQRVHSFGIKVLKSNKEFLTSPSLDDLKALILCSYIDTAKFGFEVLENLYNQKVFDTDILVCLINSIYEPARKKAMMNIEKQKTAFVDDIDLLFALAISDYRDVRKFGYSFIAYSLLDENKSNLLVGKLISYLITLGNADKNNVIEKISDISELLLKIFSSQCYNIGEKVILDLINHPSKQLQELGASIIIGHLIYSTNPPDKIIQTLIKSKYETVRGLGVRLFGQLPETELLSKEMTIVDFVFHQTSEMRSSIKKVVKRLATYNRQFGARITTLIVDRLLRTKDEDIQKDVTTFVKSDLSNIVDIPMKTIWKLLRYDSTSLKELGGFFLNNSSETKFLDMFNILELSNNEVKYVREIAWKLCENNLDRIKDETGTIIRLLDSKWDDTRNFAFDFIKNNFRKEDFTPQSLVSICDSVRGDVQNFGKDLITRFFEDKDGEEYLVKLSEHSSPNLWLFVTNYFEEYASENPEKLKILTNYFKRVLCSVNKNRIAKERIFIFLENEAMKSEELATIIAEILTFVSATVSIIYKASTIKIMTKIRQNYPDIFLPIQIKDMEVRNAI